MERDGREELLALSAAVLAVTQHLSVREVLQTIVTAARRLLDAEYAALGVPDDNGSFAEFVADGVSDEQWRALGRAPRQHGLLGVMLREARPQRLSDIRADPRFEGWPAAHPELHSFIGMPILDAGQILGAVYLANKRSGAFTTDDERLLGVLAAHAAIALTNARLYERSRELSAVEERTRIAGDLHDSVAQKLFSLRLTAQAAAALADRDPARTVEELNVVRTLAGEALDELRAIVAQLRPTDLVSGSLPDALRRLIEILRPVHAARVELHVDGYRRIAPDREDAVFRVAQEALHNALRHAVAGRIDLRLGRHDGTTVLEVRDDGVGFDAHAAATVPGRLGLASITARADAVGGTVQVTSRPGAGTLVRLEVSDG